MTFSLLFCLISLLGFDSSFLVYLVLLSVLWFDVDQEERADYDVVNQGMVATMNILSVFMLMTIMTNYDHPRRFYVNF